MQNTQAGSSTRHSLVWIGQAASGVMLLIILFLHMFFQHFQAGGLLAAEAVVAHIRNPAIFALEILFVVVVTYHALLGIRAILYDLRLDHQARRWVSRGLTIIGLATVLYGVILAYLIRSQLLGKLG